MQTRVYSPTIPQRMEGLKVAERFWTRDLFFRLGAYLLLPPAYAWLKSDFVLPFDLDWKDLAFGAIFGFLFDVFSFIGKAGRAKRHVEEDEQMLARHGPLQYRLTRNGVDLWSAGEHETRDWNVFTRFKITDELLVVVRDRNPAEYWVFPRSEVGELLPSIVGALAAGGATNVGEQDLPATATRWLTLGFGALLVVAAIIVLLRALR